MGAQVCNLELGTQGRGVELTCEISGQQSSKAWSKGCSPVDTGIVCKVELRTDDLVERLTMARVMFEAGWD